MAVQRLGDGHTHRRRDILPAATSAQANGCRSLSVPLEWIYSRLRPRLAARWLLHVLPSHPDRLREQSGR